MSCKDSQKTVLQGLSLKARPDWTLQVRQKMLQVSPETMLFLLKALHFHKQAAQTCDQKLCA